MLSTLLITSLSGRALMLQMRMWRVAKHPQYLVFYLVAGSELLILRVLHGSQDIEAIFSLPNESFVSGLTVRCIFLALRQVVKEVTAFVEIQASSASVWQALTDFASYSEWLAEAPRITGSLKEGSVLELATGMLGAESSIRKLMVHKVVRERELCWSLNASAPKLFGSERRFVIKGTATDKVEFVQSEVFTSLVSALSAYSSYRSIRQAMEQMNFALKDRAEHLEKQLDLETVDKSVWPPSPLKRDLT